MRRGVRREEGCPEEGGEDGGGEGVNVIDW